MSASSFNLRKITPEVMLLLKKEATKQKISVNSLILQILEQNLGVARQSRRVVFHDLDHLAGTWTQEDRKEFDENVKFFEKIDEELWS